MLIGCSWLFGQKLSELRDFCGKNYIWERDCVYSECSLVALISSPIRRFSQDQRKGLAENEIDQQHLNIVQMNKKEEINDSLINAEISFSDSFKKNEVMSKSFHGGFRAVVFQL